MQHLFENQQIGATGVWYSVHVWNPQPSCIFGKHVFCVGVTGSKQARHKLIDPPTISSHMFSSWIAGKKKTWCKLKPDYSTENCQIRWCGLGATLNSTKEWKQTRPHWSVALAMRFAAPEKTMRKWGLPCRDRSDRSNIESCWNCFMWNMWNPNEQWLRGCGTCTHFWGDQKISEDSSEQHLRSTTNSQPVAKLFGIDPGHTHSQGASLGYGHS